MIIFANYNYLSIINFSREINIMTFFITDLIFTPDIFIPCKKVWGLKELGILNFVIKLKFKLYYQK